MKDKKNGEKELASSKEQHQMILENIEAIALTIRLRFLEFQTASHLQEP